MSASGSNPVLAPLRRWMLYSRTNLTISIFSVLAVLFALGAVFGQDRAPRPDTAPAPDVVAAGATGVGGDVSDELVEVSEAQAASMTTPWTNAPSAAMAYVHTYVDTTASDEAWASNLGRHTIIAPGASVVSARPTVAVAITGSTTSKTVAGIDGARSAEVRIPTQAGVIRVTVSVRDVAGTQKWLVDSPLPTLDMAEIAKLASTVTTPARPPSRPATPSSSPVATPTLQQQPSTTSPPPPMDGPGVTRVDEPAPVPVPGPIPIPELDTPIPGRL